MIIVIHVKQICARLLSNENVMLQHVLKVFTVATVSIYAHHFACNNLVIEKQGNVLVDVFAEHKDSIVNKVCLILSFFLSLSLTEYEFFFQYRFSFYTYSCYCQFHIFSLSLISFLCNKKCKRIRNNALQLCTFFTFNCFL